MYENFFSKRLAQLRMAKGVSARSMSLSIGQNPSYINNIETGKTLPSMAGFFYICEYLNITPAQFFDTENQNPEYLDQLVQELKHLDAKQLETISSLVREFLRKR